MTDRVRVTKLNNTKMKIVLQVVYGNGVVKECDLCKGMKYDPLLLSSLDRLNHIPYSKTSLAYPISVVGILDYVLNGTVEGDTLNNYIYKSFCKINNSSYCEKDHVKKLKIAQFYKSLIYDVRKIRFLKLTILNHLYIEDFEKYYSDVAWVPFKYYPDLDSYGFVPKIGSNITSLKFHTVVQL